MDFSCKNCFHVWVCSWCKNRWCDDTGMPFFFEGKPTYWDPTDVWRWDTYTKKEQKKMCNANTVIQLRNISTEGAGLHS